MRKLKRSASTAVLLATLAGTAALATATPASAASYHCKTNSYTVEDPSYTSLEHALEHSTGNGNGSYEAGTLKTKASGRYQYLADGYIELDWSGDGTGYRKPLLFSASPVV